MSSEPSRPIIIRRRRKVAAAHHGGAWKVAYADFVTAMMAFFLLMWLLSTTTENQRSGLADFFSPAVPIHAAQGGGQGPFAGNSMFSADSLLEVGTGAPAEGQEAPSPGPALRDDELEAIRTALLGDSGDAAAANPLLAHLQTRLTDEGLIIEIFDLPGIPLFAGGGARPGPVLEQLLDLIGRVLEPVVNPVALTGHVGPGLARPWEISTDRALAARTGLLRAGMAAERIARVTGRADRAPVVEPAFAPRNRRLEITLLRQPLAAQ